jgi:hypothetical protein
LEGEAVEKYRKYIGFVLFWACVVLMLLKTYNDPPSERLGITFYLSRWLGD